jgi:hypothetical protein
VARPQLTPCFECSINGQTSPCRRNPCFVPGHHQQQDGIDGRQGAPQSDGSIGPPQRWLCPWDHRQPIQWQHFLARKRQTKQPIILHPLQKHPLSEAQTLRYLRLNILANNVDNKHIKEIKASQKQIVTVPKDYPELVNVIEMYHSMASILFGEGSVLTMEIGWAIVLIKQEVSTIKVRIAGDF